MLRLEGFFEMMSEVTLEMCPDSMANTHFLGDPIGWIDLISNPLPLSYR